jgi:L-ascorbate metabolism protein UlaG (beta-lactamase superfamily)
LEGVNPLVPFAIAAALLTLSVRFDAKAALAAVVAWLAVAFFNLSPTASAVLAIVALTWAIVAAVRARREGVKRWAPNALAAVAFVAGFGFAACPAVSDEALHARASSAPALAVHLGTGEGPLTITRWMHAMVSIEGGGERVLTDPWWSSRRHYDPGEALGVGAGALERVTLLTSGQDHYDHSDFEALSAAPRNVPVLVPDGTTQAARAKAAGFGSVSAMRPWQTIEIGRMHITAVPAREGVKSTDFDYETAWLYEIAGKRVLFVGHRLAPDVAAELARRFGPVDVALLAVNDLRVRPQLGKQLSMSPKDAAEIVRATKARVAIPIHYRYHGSWIQEALLLSHTGTPEEFQDEVRKVSAETIVEILAPGQPLVVD